jgi:hypothetical protein
MSLPKCHAPGHVRDAFRAMVEEWRPRDPEPSVSINGETVTASRLCGMLWNCTDVLPGPACAALALPRGSTYARAARSFRGQLPRKPKVMQLRY